MSGRIFLYHLTMAMEKRQQVNGTKSTDVMPFHKIDYVNVLVLNEDKQALVLETEKVGGGVCWLMIGRYLQPDEDPFTAVQQKLLELTGYQTNSWAYLGSHAIDESQLLGVGSLFCAQQARQVAEPSPQQTMPYVVKWVPLTDLRYALLDGRIATMSHALTVSLSLLTVLK